MRLKRIRWKGHERAITRDRYDLLNWLQTRGATVSAWMLVWEVRW
jgi:hypothetical protein